MRARETFGLLVTIALVLGACAPTGGAPQAAKPASPAGNGSAPAAGGASAGSAVAGGGAAAGAARAAIPSAARLEEAARPPEPRLTVRMAYVALVPTQSVAWIAKEAGIFDRYNLDAQLVYINGGPAGIASLVSGEIDVLLAAGSTVIRTAIQGSDTVLIAGVKPQLTGAIMARPDIRTPADLRGKRVGVAARATNAELVVRVGLLAHGIDPDADITYLAVGSGGPRVAAIQQGTIDACGCIPPDNLVAEDLGWHTVVDVTKMGYKYLATGLTATRRRMQEQPEMFRRFLQAYAEGVHKYKTDPDYALKVIVDYTQVEDLRLVREAYEMERAHKPSDLRIEPEGLRAALEDVAMQVPQAATAHPDDFVDLRLVRELQASGFFDRLGR
jgi:NitT/TauT family transport system substrate-binding protein